MILLADNDILLKLARCDLFAEFLAAFDCGHADIRIARATRFSATQPRHRKSLGDEGASRLQAFLAAVGDAPEPDPQYMAILVEHTDKNIDVGEAALFAICPCLQDAGIVTGDKRCLVGLWAAANEDENCAVLAEVLAGRLYSFEHVLTRILDLFGFDAIRQRLIDGRECDVVLRLALGSGLDANESKLRDGLTSYLNHLRQQTGNLLA